ncbi:MAG TPA: triple tyrosine motif-containing protein [Pricia sp.]|nr:triple tyrosine motif-containing protein [Pricia sp.]
MGRSIVLGTEDDGILFWDPIKNLVQACASEQGLSSDFIFSLYKLDSLTVLAGTGKGISRIHLEKKSQGFLVRNFTSSFDPYGPECNLNSVLRAENNKIWVGTTKGIYIYNANDPPVAGSSPLIYLNSVSLFSKKINSDFQNDTLYAWSLVPKDLRLTNRQNHLTFDFNGVFFSNPKGLKYEYKLEGADTAYAARVATNKVIYPNLNPGKYGFKVRAITEDYVKSSNSVDFPFVIERPIYQKTWFSIFLAMLLVSGGFLLHYGRISFKKKRLAYNQKIRLEEQQSVMQRTSEDLHDDLGNKITRITVLADVLQRKLDQNDIEKTKLVDQIKENAQAFYLGTKDIIWSLTPGNDSLFDLLEKCKLTGTQLFADTNIEFVPKGTVKSLTAVKLPLAIGRNLNMIVKEAFTNILRHSGANKAVMKVNYSAEQGLGIAIVDNGKGITNIEDNRGNGLNNMYKRIERIGGTLNVLNTPDGGLMIRLNVKIPQNEG